MAQNRAIIKRLTKGWTAGGYPDRTARVNFHSSCSTKGETVIASWSTTCEVHADVNHPESRFLIVIHDSLDANGNKITDERFPASITKPRTARRPNGAIERIYPLEQVKVYVADLVLPYLIDYFVDDKTAHATTRMLADGIPPSYGSDGQTAIYEMRFEHVGITPMYYGSIGGGFDYDPETKTYGVGLRTIFETSIFNPNDGIAVKPTLPSAVYLVLKKRDRDTGELIDIKTPSIEGAQNGIVYGKVGAMGNFGCVLRGLEPETEYFYYLSPVTIGSEFETTVKAGDFESPLFEHWRTRQVTQPENPSRLITPPIPTERGEPKYAELITKPFRMGFGSCFDGNMDSLAGADDLLLDIFFLLGDTYYMDNAKDSPDFMSRYITLLRNPRLTDLLRSTGILAAMDDHENRDNYDGVVRFLYALAAQFVLNSGELALYNRLVNVPENSKYRRFMPFRISGIAGQQFISSIPADDITRMTEAFKAFYDFFPAIPPSVPTNNPCFSLTWGSTKLIVLNSKPTLQYDNSGAVSGVQYYKAQVTVDRNGQVSPLKDPEPQFIPGPSEAYLLQELQSARNNDIPVVFVGFASHLAPTYTPEEIDEMEALLKQAVHELDPSVSEQTVQSMFRKIHYQNFFNTADMYQSQLLRIKDAMKQIGIRNVFFQTGDPHTSSIEYWDRDFNYVIACSSSVGNYRSNGAVSQLFGNQQRRPNAILAWNQNSWMEMISDPAGKLADDVNPGPKSSTKGVTIRIRYAHTIGAEVFIPVSNKPGHREEPTVEVKERGWFSFM